MLEQHTTMTSAPPSSAPPPRDNARPPPAGVEVRGETATDGVAEAAADAGGHRAVANQPATSSNGVAPASAS